ncbi:MULTISPECIES: hypothetical protein [unclassified Streptomyces]|uniref:hypothetical protein n=1 Tax=unclassified Streptomyces TaxID=2593676 RepID=UPI001F3DB500|nr:MULTISPECIES: hypothetical protein [unclassified Streptomyces]
MARYTFGAGIGDFVVTPNDGQWTVASGAVIAFWDAADGGTQHTDLLTGAGTPVTEVVTDEYGMLPQFRGPDGVSGMWADAGGSSRAWVEAHGGAAGDTITTKGVVVPEPPADGVSYVIWRAPHACTVTAVRGYREGGSGATVNATVNGADLLAVDLSLSTPDTWLSGPAVQNAPMAAGDTLAVAVRSAAGTPTAITILIDIQGLG